MITKLSYLIIKLSIIFLTASAIGLLVSVWKARSHSKARPLFPAPAVRCACSVELHAGWHGQGLPAGR
jgi:hypothetical protein